MFPAPQPPMQRATQEGNPGNPGTGMLSRIGQAQQSPNAMQILGMLNQKIQELEQKAGDIMQLQALVDPEGQAYLVPIAEGGKALKARLQEIMQRMQAGPGAPSAAQASGGGTPAPNPDEGQAPAAMAA